MKREVLVFTQKKNNSIAEISFELLGKGREIADKLGATLAAVVIGSRNQNSEPGRCKNHGQFVSQGKLSLKIMQELWVAVFLQSPSGSTHCPPPQEKPLENRIFWNMPQDTYNLIERAESFIGTDFTETGASCVDEWWT